MKERKENVVNLLRVFRAKPEKLFKAFAEPKAYSWWIAPYGYLCEIHQMDFNKNGDYSMSFINFSTGEGHSFGGKFLEIIPNKFLQVTDKFDDPNLTEEMTTSVSFKEVSCGTELSITQENIPAAIPLEMCYLGWQESLNNLSRLVEPEVPGG